MGKAAQVRDPLCGSFVMLMLAFTSGGGKNNFRRVLIVAVWTLSERWVRGIRHFWSKGPRHAIPNRGL